MPGGKQIDSGSKVDVPFTSTKQVDNLELFGLNPVNIVGSAVPGLIVADFVAPGDQLKMALAGALTIAGSPFVRGALAGGSQTEWLRVIMDTTPALALGGVYLVVRKSGNTQLVSLLCGFAGASLLISCLLPKVVHEGQFFKRQYFKTGAGSRLTKKIPDWGHYGPTEDQFGQ